MNTRRIAVALTMLWAVAANLQASDRNASCSNASLRGTYGYSSQGFSSVPPDISPALFLPEAQSGLVVYDGKGAITSGTYTLISTDPGGGVSRGTFTGTYSVNSDCTGSAEVHIDVGGAVHLDLVVLSPSEYAATATDAGSSFVYSAKKIQAPRD